jgi:ABC-3C biological conflict system middle component
MTTSNSMYEVRLFNGWLETGIRALVVLNAAHPLMFDLSQLTWFDHLVVHTGDIGGPKSLHPDLPHRSGELLVRRAIIEQSLTLMRRLHLIDVMAKDDGILYQASDEAYTFLELMRSSYAKELKDRARWLAEHICTMEAARLQELITEKIGRWAVEFQSDTTLLRGLP